MQPLILSCTNKCTCNILLPLYCSWPQSFKNKCHTNPHTSGLVSLLQVSISSSKSYAKTHFMLQWEEELGKALSEEDCMEIWTLNAKSSLHFLALNNSYKVLFHWYLMPSESLNLYPSTHCASIPVDRKAQLYIFSGHVRRLADYEFPDIYCPRL